MLYGKEGLESLPSDVTEFSLGCGNPIAIAELNEGEVVLDLGSGGGLDCFLASQKVGDKGNVIGLDMTPEMIKMARVNAIKVGVTNVEFRLGEMEHMPVNDSSVDAIISNCVINLSPDKDSVFKEAYRVLKPGGRLSISDMVLLGDLPRGIKESLEEWAGCIAGALPKQEYLDKIKAAGFVKVTSDETVVPLYADCEAQEEGESKPYMDLSSKIASIRVKAFKPKKPRRRSV
jgi:ubiquinone/menaquinone biosynthesis C-methylase UbiE